MSCHESDEPARPNPSGNAPIRPWFGNECSSRVITGVGAGDSGATIVTVTTTVTTTPGEAPPGPPAVVRPPLVRPHSGRLLAGVSVGTAAHLRQDPLVVRVAIVVLAVTGIGVVAYALLWLLMPAAAPGTENPTPVIGPRTPATGRRSAWSSWLRRGGALHQLSSWGDGEIVRPAGAGRRRPRRHLAAARHRPDAQAAECPLGARRRRGPRRRRRRPAARHHRSARRRPGRLRGDAGDPRRCRAGDRADLAAVAHLPRGRAHRARPLGGAGGGRGAPARLRPADARPHPAATPPTRRRSAGWPAARNASCAPGSTSPRSSARAARGPGSSPAWSRRWRPTTR